MKVNNNLPLLRKKKESESDQAFVPAESDDRTSSTSSTPEINEFQGPTPPSPTNSEIEEPLVLLDEAIAGLFIERDLLVIKESLTDVKGTHLNAMHDYETKIESRMMDKFIYKQVMDLDDY